LNKHGIHTALETWSDTHETRPRLVGELGDSALMEVRSSGGRGFTVVHTVVNRTKALQLQMIAKAKDCRSEFYAHLFADSDK
jgi:hypothetical protein